MQTAMRRVRQLETVRRVSDEEERRRAERLAAAERRLKENEAKLTELTSYQGGYVNDFAKRVSGGLDGARISQFQAFLTRLGEAVRQQREIVERARAERDAQLASWREAAQRAQMVGRVVKSREDEVRRDVERQEQRESDERGLETHRRRGEP